MDLSGQREQKKGHRMRWRWYWEGGREEGRESWSLGSPLWIETEVEL